AYPDPPAPTAPLTGGADGRSSVVPLFPAGTTLEPATVTQTATAIITTVGDRVRDRHARESQFRIYDHFLPLYFQARTHSLEIIDEVAKGGSKIVFNMRTVHPMDAPNFRAFFRGLNTVAEYFHNADFTKVNDFLYTTTVTFNAKDNHPIRIGDRMEVEVGIFLANPIEGRFNYYSSVMLYIVGTGGIAPFEGIGSLLDSFPLPDKALLGGRTTLNYPYSNEPDKRFMQLATNLAPISAQPWVEGRRLHHTDFNDGTHSEPQNPVFTAQSGKVGPNFVAKSCVSCHVRNGRGVPPAVNSTLANYAVEVRELSGSTAGPHSRLGSVLQSFSTNAQPEATVRLAGWVKQTGRFTDGTAFELQRPALAGTGPVPTIYSARIAPPLVGLGLLEAVDESTIAALVDINDANGDGVSGRIQFVTDPQTGATRLGRFGYKAVQPRLQHQVAIAFNRDMGVKTSIFPTLDCGSAQSGCTSSKPNVADADVQKLTRYIALLGVPARRDHAGAQANAGEALFTSAGCATCHRATLTTSANHPNAELRSQTIRPYTDLLLHDLGPGLADNLPQGTASGAEWRTTPLWGIGHTADVSGTESYLHDGRARNLSEAILWHDGEARTAKTRFSQMSASDRAALIAFLKTL
ncbi:MAG: c-type cytochrome, partial [Myxococcales bacterium]|nr:c-type cytochrome [Myxococcales bacterium]